MKQLIALLLILLLFTGCAQEVPEETTVPTVTTEPTTEPSTEDTQPPATSLYQPNSALEQLTSGVVKSYTVRPNCNAVYPMGDNLLVFYTGEQTTIRVYTGEELMSVNGVVIYASVAPGNRGVQLSESGMSYYDSGSREIILLDANLAEKKRVPLPESAQGIPAVDPTQTKAYFCTENEIRSLDLATGIAALLRQETVVWQSMYDVCFDGRILLCDVIDRDQNAYLAYIDTENGKLMGKDDGGWDLDSFGDAFLLSAADDSGSRALYGTWDGETLEFIPAGENTMIWNLLKFGGAVGVHYTTEGMSMDFYTMESGLRTASVTLPTGYDASGFVADNKGMVWFLLTDRVTQNKTLCRWDMSQSAVEDDTVYLLPRYTELVPDVDGLYQCKDEADILGATYGMKITIWKDAVNAPWTDLKADYRVSSFRNTLRFLEDYLSEFPEGMVSRLSGLSKNGATSVSIVRGEGESAQSYFKWVDGSIYIAVETGEIDAASFSDALYRAMDTYILNSNSILDEWDSHEPVNDRAMIFRYAMSDGMEDHFTDEYAQSKLAQLCKAIRYAFDLRNYEGELLWEQYLVD